MTKARDIADGVDTADIADGAISTAKLADNSINATKIDVSGNGTAGQFLSSDGDGTMTWADAGGGFDLGTALTGTTPTIDWSSATAFSHTLTGDTTYSFSNVPSGGEIELYLKNVGKKADYSNPIYNGSYVATSDVTDIREVYHAFYNNDGSKVYVTMRSISGGSTVFGCHQYSLSTNYDITTATYEKTKTITTGTFLQNMLYGSKHFFDNGTKLTSGSQTALHEIGVFNLNTAYDIGTINTTYTTTSISSVVTAAGLSGTNFYASGFIFDSTGDNILVYQANNNNTNSTYGPALMKVSLSTAYDITSTKTLVDHQSDFLTAGGPTIDGAPNQANNNNLIQFSPDGKYIFWGHFIASPERTYNLWIWEMETPYDTTTIRYVGAGRYPRQSGNYTLSSYDPITFLPSPDYKYMNMWWDGTSSDGYLQSETWRSFTVFTDYQTTFPATVSTLPSALGTGPDPATTSYLRMVSLDGTNVLITDHREI
jgi:hypothetical protein